MKLEQGKRYQLSDGSIHKATGCTGDCMKVGPWHYVEETADQYVAHGKYPTVVREIEPLRLEIGKLYEMSNGKSEICEPYPNSEKMVYLGGHSYKLDGDPVCSGNNSPYVLYKLRVNEPPEPEMPKPIPFRIDGPGWYKLRLGSWVKLTLINGWLRNWDENGVSRFPWALSDVTTKATPEQARILDAL